MQKHHEALLLYNYSNNTKYFPQSYNHVFDTHPFMSSLLLGGGRFNQFLYFSEAGHTNCWITQGSQTWPWSSTNLDGHGDGDHTKSEPPYVLRFTSTCRCMGDNLPYNDEQYMQKTGGPSRGVPARNTPLWGYCYPLNAVDTQLLLMLPWGY